MPEKIQTSDSVERLAGVGPAIADKLARLHVHTIEDVLFHLPLRYEDRTSVTQIGALLDGASAVVIGEIELAQVVIGRRRSLLVRIADGTGFLTIRLFHFSRAQEKAFRRGFWVRCFGPVRRGQNGFEIVHPEYRVFAERPVGGLSDTLTPIYPTTDGISQTLWRKIVAQSIKLALPQVNEILPHAALPEKLREQGAAISLADAVVALHQPVPEANLSLMAEGASAAHQRLIFEELLAHHFSLRAAREVRAKQQAPSLAGQSDLLARFLTQLPFSLTAAQDRVCAEVATDLESQIPMMRLVQGDVGSGKTVVAAAAMLQAAAAGVQSVLMAPTELLAEQHYKTLSGWFEPLGVEVGWLASKTPSAEKKLTLQRLADGELPLAVGTHALIQDAVEYKNLGLAVIDEQHRFGVDQRLALRNKTPGNHAPHQMLMTATPIPRTLAMSFYADLDVSSIDELPPGRTPVETLVMSIDAKRQAVVERVQKACQNGKQVYWVCPLIDESEALAAQAATDTFAELTEYLQGLNVGLVHGRLKTQEKEAAMAAFRQGQTHLLVSTTVIEVGVDVPNASLMVIENAERMGLAQLHQLRGRVGRGSEKSYCILLYQSPLSEHARERLRIIRETNDGFELAEQDLKMRGAGELLGTRQTGSLSFKVADLLRDQALLPQVSASARIVLKDFPDRIEPLINRWVGSREGYVNA